MLISSPGSASFVRTVALWVAALNLLVIAIAVMSLHASLNTHEAKALSDAENISLEQQRDILAIFDNVNLALQNLNDNYLDRQRSGNFSSAGWDAALARQRSHLPILDGLRGTDAKGQVLYGLSREDASRASIADRDYFRTLRDTPNADLVISNPVLGRVTRKWSIVLARRLNELDGAFGGIVAATVPLEHIRMLFASDNLGPQASIALHDGALRLIARHPELPGKEKAGAQYVSAEFKAALQANRNAGHYQDDGAGSDGIRRIHSYRHLPAYDFYITVGVAEDDYLADWRDELRKTVALLAIFGLITSALAWQLGSTWKRKQEGLEKLQQSEFEFRQLVASAPFGIALINPDGRISHFNPAFTRMLGYTLADIPDVDTWWSKAYPDPDYRRHVMGIWQQTVIEQALPTEVIRTFKVCRSDGAFRDIQFVVVPMKDGRITITFEDITEKLHAEALLKAERDRSQLYLDTAQSLMVALDASGHVTMVNPYACALLEYRADELTGKNWFATCLPQPESMERVFPYFQRLIRGEAENEEYFENYLVTSKGKLILVAWHNALLRDPAGQVIGTLSAGEDITRRRAAEQEIHNLAFFDPLTGLPNRRLLVDRLQHSMAASTRSGKYRALFFLDLDNFKELNDTQGHDVGDRLLIETAQRLRSCVREGDTVSRLGGDEFVVILEQLSEDIKEAAGQAGAIAEKIIARLNDPFTSGKQAYRTTTSIGITLFIGHEVSVEEILKRADLAMYQAKAAGRDTVRFFEHSMQENVAARAALAHDLRHAISAGEFVLFFQPQVDSRGNCVGVEALLRWQSPQRGCVAPLEFIPFAEETGLILPIGGWVLHEACKRLTEWQSHPHTAGLSMAINVSAQQFKQKDFLDATRRALETSGAKPELLKIEITESLLLEDVETVIAKMTALRQLGVSFSLDDFGTGYSSLAYVKRLPLHQLKIDQSFVRDVLLDQNDTAICRAIIALGDSLGLEIIAEGVESASQWDFLRSEGCRFAQGYHFARPMPADEFLLWLKNLPEGNSTR